MPPEPRRAAFVPQQTVIDASHGGEGSLSRARGFCFPSVVNYRAGGCDVSHDVNVVQLDDAL
jgi:hypothetical protein